MTIEAKLQDLGLELPEPPPPAANYRPWTQSGNLLFVSGQLPMRGGSLAYSGAVGKERSVEEGYEAARLAILNVLAQVKSALGGLGRIRQVVRIEGHVASAPGFHDQSKVINGASDLLREVLGDRSGHARVALGHIALPLGATVEIAAVIEVEDGARA